MDDSEKNKVLELLKEMRKEPNIDGDKAETDSSHISWMYKGPSELVDREEYLLGRTIDKSFELLNNISNSDACLARTSEQSNVPKRLLEKTDNTEQVDIAKKILEDPLYAIRQKELEARKKLLNNPVKLKQIKQMLLERSKSNINQKKKKKSKKKMSSAEDLDLKIMKRLTKFSEKEKRKALNHVMKSDSDYSLSESNSSAFDKSNSKKLKKKKLSSEEASNSSSNSICNSEPYSDSEFEMKNKTAKKKRKKSRSRERETVKKTRYSSSSDSSSSSDRYKKSKRKKNTLSKKNNNRKSSVEVSSSSSSIDSSPTSSDSDSDEVEKKPKKSKKLCNKSSSVNINHRAGSNINKKVKSSKKKKIDRMREKEKKKSKNRESFEKFPNDAQKSRQNYGLMMPDGSKPKTGKDYSSVQKYEKPVEAKTKFVTEKVQPLSEKEKEEKLKEMMENAKLRKEDREKNLARHRKIQSQEDDLKTYDSDFMRRQMSHLTSQGTMADRIKSNINNIQRSKSSMDDSFMRK